MKPLFPTNVLRRLLMALMLLGSAGGALADVTPLADTPIVTNSQVPPNVMMTLSVEWPTGVVAAYNDNTSTTAGYECPGRDSGVGACFFMNRTYLGYFDPAKCYSYDTTKGYFLPKDFPDATTKSCSGKAGTWSGNYLNWATMHALDSFRYAMTGGDRYVDTATETVIEKSRHTGQGGHGQFPRKRVRNTAYSTVPAIAPGDVSPESGFSALFSRINSGNAPLWAGTSRAGQVMQVANNINFWKPIGTVRYIKIQLAGSNPLSLAEVKVLNSSGTNVALTSTGRVLSQSSTYATTSGPAKAVDNNTDGNYGNGSVTHTNTDAQAWWQIKLSASTAVSTIDIYGRSDCCTDRLSNFYVFASSNDMSGKTIEELLNDSSVWSFHQGDEVGADASGNRRLTISPSSTDVVRDAMNVRVRVCDSSIGLESNCKAYGSSYKPTGIVQDNADRMRFGVTAYLNVDGTQSMGGVVRTPLKYVGPKTIVPSGTPATNPHAEISGADGTLIADPDSAAVSGDIVSSGAINYINKFGKLGTKWSLKSIDTTSEMFYEALRYLRGFSASTSQFTTYTGADTVAARDGFPVYKDWTLSSWSDVSALDKRAIQYSCQKSYFVGIGDTNTWCDTWAPGNGYSSGYCAGHNGGPSDSLINAASLADTIGGNETGLPTNLGSTYISTGRSDSYYISSFAYWANTNDLAPDDNTKSWTKGKQTAQTYWVDVKETPSFNGIVEPKNQYWLAAKYGNYDSTKYTLADLRANPAQFDPLDKSYFTGERPDKLISALRAVFSDIGARQASGAPAALSSNNLSSSSGGTSFQVQFDSTNWTGEVIAYSVTMSASGSLSVSNLWQAADKLDAQNWDTGRRIVSFNPATSSRKGVKFRYVSSPTDGTLSATQLAYFGTTVADRTNLINYLRGERTYEKATSSSAAKYRERTHVLGDMVNSEPAYVGIADDNFSDEFNPGYSTFAAGTASRTPVLYVGANDGMLHAFNASKSGGGEELFAYIPSAVLSGPSSPATPTVDGIASRANLTFSHRYLVDQGPLVRNVDFGNTGGSVGSPDWRTLLVGGLGKGGRSYYAIDVTSPPNSATTEDQVAAKILWEFTDEDMGFSFTQPVIMKTKKYGWVVMVASGYNNTLGSVAANRGKGYLYILNAKTGALLKKISTGIGSATDPSGLAKIIGFAPDAGDYTADSVYGGDLLGNLWRFDLTAADGNYPTPTKIAELKDASGNAQPITVNPRVAIYPGSISRWVFVGTGRLLDASDRANAKTQSFYAIRDGIQSRAYTSSTLPSGVSFPVKRGNLGVLQSTALIDGISPDTATQKPMGWVVDFGGTNTEGATERMVDSITVNSGLVTFSTKIPTVDPCAPGVSSRLYALDQKTGASQLMVDGAVVSSAVSDVSVLKGDVVIGAGGGLGIVLNTGRPEQGPQLKPAVSGIVRMNWREVLQ